ncbi:MAG: ectoine/hydroxyectoine ABC transporter permease subunit EhuC [Mycobacteriales bacterium]
MDALADFGPWVEALLQGIWLTVLVTAVSAACALVVAFVLGLMAGAPGRLPRTLSRIVVEFFRGTSLFVQLYWLYFVLPQLGYRLDAFAIAVLAFAMNFGAYGSEVVRGAVNAVPKPQREATIALNMTPYQRMRLVILPQAVVGMIPPFGNLLIQLLKSTPLVFTITLVDVMAVTKSYRDSEGNTFFIFTLALGIYFVLAYLTTLLMSALERRAKARIGQPAPPRRGLLSWTAGVQGEVR